MRCGRLLRSLFSAPLLLLLLATPACLGNWGEGDEGSDGPEDAGVSDVAHHQGGNVLPVEVVPGRCAPDTLAPLRSPYLFWEVYWEATPQRLQVNLHNTFGGMCDTLQGGATYDAESQRLALFYEASGDSSCESAAQICGDAWRTDVGLTMTTAGVGLTDSVTLDVTRGRRGPDYTNVMFVERALCLTWDSQHSVAAVDTVGLADPPADKLTLELRVLTPGPADCYELGHHTMYAADRTIVWPHVTTRSERCSCQGAPEWTTLLAEVGANPAGPQPIYVLAREPDGSGFKVMGLPPS